MYVLGISCFYHDAAACLLHDGQIVAAAEEERFSRRKHDAEFPVHAVRFCLEHAGIGPEQLDAVAFYEKPLLKFERILSSHIDGFPQSFEVFTKAMTAWLREKLWIGNMIVDQVSHRGRIWFGEHHLSHAASAFYPSSFDAAAVLTADGVGEWATTTAGVAHDKGIELIKEIRFPHSLGLLYSAFTAYLGFEVNEGEYKVMGMAAYGRPRYLDQVRRLVDVAQDGSFQLDMRYFEHHRSVRSFGRRLVALLGPPRRPEAPLEQRYADIAASVQCVLEDILLRLARDLRQTTGLPDLCMAGGVALNGLANACIYREAGFRRLFVPPAAGDSGGALGVAAFVSHEALHEPRMAPMRHAFLGPDYREETLRFLERHDIPAVLLSDGELVERVADLLARGAVVGWFRGRMEFGPRALGARSILASPCRPEMKDLLNEKIKHRETFRPFAPAVPIESSSDYFELDCESPFMLQIVSVRPERRDEIPAVTHVDGTARLQTVAPDTQPIFHDLLRAFERRTGTPVLINTSFNVRGEPIVCGPADAFHCFSTTDMDYLVMGNALIGPDAKRREVPYAMFPPPRYAAEVVI